MQKLAEIKGLSDAKVEKLLDAARKLCSNYGWQTAKTMEIQVSSLHSMACMCTATTVSDLLGAKPICAPRHAQQHRERVMSALYRLACKLQSRIC